MLPPEGGENVLDFRQEHRSQRLASRFVKAAPSEQAAGVAVPGNADSPLAPSAVGVPQNMPTAALRPYFWSSKSYVPSEIANV